MLKLILLLGLIFVLISGFSLDINFNPIDISFKFNDPLLALGIILVIIGVILIAYEVDKMSHLKRVYNNYDK